MERIVLDNGQLQAEITPLGAELKALRLAGGIELLWPGDAAHWPRSAPILFPVVGRLVGDSYTHDRRHYALGQHGFARDRVFTVTERDATAATLLLRADGESRRHYPFDFELQVRYALRDSGIETHFAVRNAGHAAMPFAIGGHPGFRWPLEPRFAKTDYVLLFEEAETGRRYLVRDGLLTGAQGEVPWRGPVLPLDEALFTEDAIVLRHPASRWVRYQPRAGGLGIRVDFAGFPDLGIWSKPGGAPFLCIEPWHGHASLMDEAGDLSQKRDMRSLAPGAEFACSFSIEALQTPPVQVQVL